MTTVTKIYTFEASHNLPHHKGACHNLHGHSYKLEVTVGGSINSDHESPQCGMIIDFKNLKDIIEKVAGKYDHSYLNDFFPNPTAEIMVRKIAKDISLYLPEGSVLVSCKLWETATSYAEFSPMLSNFFGKMCELIPRELTPAHFRKG